MIGTVLGPFTILEELGAGGMGVVYRARDERLRRDVAIKVLPARALSDESSRKAFLREAVALSRLNHACIATIHDFQSADGVDFLVMEYIPGESLDKRVARGPMANSGVISVGIQLADGLAAAHRQGVVHRDLKPGNLRVTPEGQLKILDFGLAKWQATDTKSLANVTEKLSVTIVGTPAYMPPEVLNGQVADARSDLYSAGVVLYELVTGSLPFPGLPTGAMVAAIVHNRPPTARSRNPHVSAELDAVITKCMNKEPGSRYASAEEVGDALRALAARPTGAKSKRQRQRQRRSFAAVATGLIVVFGAVAVYLLWSQNLAARPTLQSLAVLPLGNLSGDAEQEYFADGMTEELIAQLSHVRSIRVISLTSAMRYKKNRPAMPQIARELGVDGVIEGSVFRSRDRVRTTVHLIDAHRDEQLWSGQYDGDTTDVMRLQTQVANAIVREIRARLSPAERARLGVQRRVDPVAYQHYLRGRYQWNRRTPSSIRLGIDYFQNAIARDSLFALAYAGLADAWAASGLYGVTSPREARTQAHAAALRGVALDPELSEAHTSLAHVLHNFDWNWGEAEKDYLRAIALGPSNAVAHHWYASLLAQQGRFQQATAELQRAQELDPLSLSIALAGGVHAYYARDYDQALEQVRRAAELDSSNSLIYRLEAGILDKVGREKEALQSLARSFELKGQPEVAGALRQAYAAGGMRGALDLLIAGLVRKRETGAYEPAEHIAELYARTGRADEAFHWLEVAYQERDTELNRLLADPIFDPLRADPRFGDLLRRVGLPMQLPRS